MSRFYRTTALTLVLVLALLLPAGLVHATPSAAVTTDGVFTLDSLFDRVLAWLGSWISPGSQGWTIDPKGDVSRAAGAAPAGVEKAGMTSDPNGNPGETGGAACGDEGPMVDPDGSPCSG